MNTATVSSKGQITIPKGLRQRLGIRPGSRMAFSLVGDHLVMRVRSPPEVDMGGGFGMLKSRRPTVPASLDPASIARK